MGAENTVTTMESERSLTQETERQKKKWRYNLVKNIDSQMKMFKTNLRTQLNLDIEKSFLLEDRLKAEMTQVLKQTEAEIKKMSKNITDLVAKWGAAEEQSLKAVVAELENIFSAGASGGGMNKYEK